MKTPRTTRLHVLTLALLAVACATAQVDQDWLEKWNESQSHRPKVLTSHSRIAAADEPGTALVIQGRILHPDGSTPEPGAVVFAYHTDNTGVYYAPGSTKRSYRLRGWAKTDADGRFEFATIRPAPYPGRNVPAHVHFTVETKDYGRQSFGLLFDDDALVSVAEREQSKAKESFGDVLQVERKSEGQRVRMNVRLKAKGDF